MLNTFSLSFLISGSSVSSLINLSQPKHFLFFSLNIVFPLLSCILEINFGSIFSPPLTNGAYSDVKFIIVFSSAPSETDNSS